MRVAGKDTDLAIVGHFFGLRSQSTSKHLLGAFHGYPQLAHKIQSWWSVAHVQEEVLGALDDSSRLSRDSPSFPANLAIVWSTPQNGHLNHFDRDHYEINQWIWANPADKPTDGKMVIDERSKDIINIMVSHPTGRPPCGPLASRCKPLRPTDADDRAGWADQKRQHDAAVWCCMSVCWHPEATRTQDNADTAQIANIAGVRGHFFNLLEAGSTLVD